MLIDDHLDGTLPNPPRQVTLPRSADLRYRAVLKIPCKSCVKDKDIPGDEFTQVLLQLNASVASRFIPALISWRSKKLCFQKMAR